MTENTSRPIVVIDNYDSFTHNLVQYFGVLFPNFRIFKNDQVRLSFIEKLNPIMILISPGPKSPSEAGLSKECISAFAGKFPIFGVCLGHQAIGEVFGADVRHAPLVMHGKVSVIEHDGKTVFKGIPKPLLVARYHSLLVSSENFPDEELQISATTQDNLIMGMRHRKYPIEGVQFHPESVLTDHGHAIIRNALEMAIKWCDSVSEPVFVPDPYSSTLSVPDQTQLQGEQQGEGAPLAKSIGSRESCSACGLCIGLCPQIREWRETIRITGNCSSLYGNCTRFCPWESGDGALTDALQTSGLGDYKSIRLSSASAFSIQEAGQYGGTVTALLSSILNKADKDGVLLVKRDDQSPISGRPFTASTVQEVLSCAGSCYTTVPSLKQLPYLIRYSPYNRLHIVGRGCQIRAARRYISSLPQESRSKVGVMIGLFCMWALDYHNLEKITKEIPLSKPWVRFNISDEGLIISNSRGENCILGMDKIRPAIRPACLKCGDFSAELSDISIGWAANAAGQNTLVVRTGIGERLIKEAVDSGAIGVRELNDAWVEELEQIADTNKERARQQLYPFLRAQDN